MKKLSINQIHRLLAELYWKAHGDGQVSASWGTDFDKADITISNSIVNLYPKQRAAYVLRKLAALPNTRVKATKPTKARR